MDIRNIPLEAAYYEFVVAIPNGDHYTFLGMYADEQKATNTALEYGGIVIHRVQIQGYQPPKPKEKYYIFSGMWSWGCWAASEEEARKQFDDTFLDEFDIDTDNFKIKIEED